LIFVALIFGILAPVRAQSPAADPSVDSQSTVVEASIAEMTTAMHEGRLTSRQIVAHYLDRIDRFEGVLNAAISINPRALDEADERDRERAAGGVLGPLHGIPIALKDNIQTTDLPTTGGMLAFRGYVPPYDATIVRNLREAGAIIIAKTGLTEMANWMAAGMPGNYNAVSGFAMNPYDPRPDPREETRDGRPALSTDGSSSGVGTAANLWTASIGTETDGSILTAANQTMLAAIKPTVGRLSRYGIIPVTADQDTPGPMSRSVADAALLLGALEGQGVDPNDPMTGRCTEPPDRDYAVFLDPNALRGARLGVPRAFFVDPIRLRQSAVAIGGLDAARFAVFAEALEIMRSLGAVIVDPTDIPSVTSADPESNLLFWPVCSDATAVRGGDAYCSTVLKYGMKRDFNAWLATLGSSAPVRTLTELRAWNLGNRAAGSTRYGQARLDISDEVDLSWDAGRYASDREKDLRLATTEGIDSVMREFDLDALIFPGASGASIAARAGYPMVIVPFGSVENTPNPPFPAGFDARPAPFGVSFAGLACAEPRLIGIAYAFEQATRRRIPPDFTTQ